MAKPHAGAVSTPRPRSSSGAKAAAATTPANRSSVGSSSSAPPARDLAPLAKEAGKLLTYDDDDAASHASAATLPEGLAVADLAPPLDLPDPDNDTAASSSTVVPAPPCDAVPAPARSAVIQLQVARPADVNATHAGAEGYTVLTELEVVLAELRGASGLSARSKRLLAALAEAALDELDVLRTRRAAFWRKLRVGVLAATVFSVAAMDAVLLAALLGGPRGSGRHTLPPT